HNVAEAVVSISVLGIDFQGLAIRFHRLLVALQVKQDIAKANIGISELGIDFDGLAECFLRFLKALQLTQVNAEVDVGKGMLGIDLQGLAVRYQRLLRTLQLAQDDAEVVVGLQLPQAEAPPPGNSPLPPPIFPLSLNRQPGRNSTRSPWASGIA